MSWGVHLCVLIALVQVFVIAGVTDTNDFTGLQALKNEWKNVPPNWRGADPCGNGWDGIKCVNNRVVSIMLASKNLVGELSSDIDKLSELQILDLSYNKGMTGPLPQTIGSLTKLISLILVGCGFTNPIPDSIGSLQLLVFLSLNSNNFIGRIPPSLGNLPNLYWLDLADNQLSGSIPISSGSTPGLDMLLHTKHFHFGGNRLSGEIPPQLFSSNMSLIHLLLERNQFTGSIPSTIRLMNKLEVVRLDNNSLSGPVPASLTNNLTNLTSLHDLYLANNQLSGPLPDLSGLSSINYVDMSNNSFDTTDIPTWFSSFQSLTTLIMENTQIRGALPSTFFSLPQLQTVSLKNNSINGTLAIGSSPSSQLELVDLQSNMVDSFTQQAGGYNFQIILANNPICTEGAGTESYCNVSRTSNTPYSTPPQNCMPVPCNSAKTSSPTCQCSYPYTGILLFRAPTFSDYGNTTIFQSLHDKLMNTSLTHGLPVDSVALSNPTKNIDNYLELSLQVFPSGQDSFTYSAISGIAFMLSNQTFKPPPAFGPYVFHANNYPYFAGLKAGRKLNMAVIIGAAAGGIVLLLLLILAGFYAFRQRRRAERAKKKGDPFASWDSTSNSGAVPQLKGAKCFSYDELKKCANNFSDSNVIGSGGYGKVYRGILSNGQLVAIKRAQQGSTQGGLEFKTEIELLSRVHHKNVVSLVGFCFNQGEQMLVYEFIANGTLKDSLCGRTGIRLDWTRRLRIAVGAARGLQYLHDLANPPIIHRDIKSNNILLDDRLNAKVADFGLSKPMGDPDKGHITTQVKGTMGYLDPEYYMTNQLTEKSDVYSFGVLMLEILTARTPIEKGKYIVRELKQAMDKTKDLYALEEFLDPIVAATTAPRSVEKFIDLAMMCVLEMGADRPAMNEVVKEMETIMELAGLNPKAESASASASYNESGSKGYEHPYSNDSLFAHSVAYPPSKVEAK